LNAYDGGMEAQHEALEGLQTNGVDSHHFDEEQYRNPHWSEKSDPEPEPQYSEKIDPDPGPHYSDAVLQLMISPGYVYSYFPF
jgi:hypothetical protein